MWEGIAFKESFARRRPSHRFLALYQVYTTLYLLKDGLGNA